MDTTIAASAATDTDEANEIHQQLSSSYDEKHFSDSTAESSTTSGKPSLSLPIKSNLATLSKHSPTRINEIIDGKEKSSNSYNQKTPTNDGNYNDYVNNLYEGANGKLEVIEDGEIKPLLKSIVKSPTSVNAKPSIQINGNRTKSKRLSWQATDSSRRHVISTPLQHNDSANGPQTQSTSLDSSEEQPTQDSPSTPLSGSSSSSSSDDEDEEFSEKQALDGGYGWVIVFASFLINMIADGITFSFGIFNVEFLKYFGDSKGKTAWIGSIFMASPLLSGPIASYLTDRYGCRKVTMVGSITAAIGFLLSAFCDSMEMLFITFGVIAGLGLSLCYVAAIVIVAYYFDKKRSFATGISVCGSGIGTFIFPPIIQYLITVYGWRGCTVILAGIFLNMCVCGALMKDLEWTSYRAKQKRKNRKKRGTSFDSFSITTSTNNGTNSIAGENGVGVEFNIVEAIAEDDPHLFSSLINLPTFAEKGETVSY